MAIKARPAAPGLRCAILAVACLWAAASGAAPRDWIGHIVPPWPPGLEHVSAVCVDTENRKCVMTLDLLRDADRNPYLAVAVQFVGNDPDHLAQLADIITLPPIPPGYVLVWGICSTTRPFARGVSAIVNIRTGREIWAVAVHTGRREIRPIRPDEIDCPVPDLKARD